MSYNIKGPEKLQKKRGGWNGCLRPLKIVVNGESGFKKNKQKSRYSFLLLTQPPMMTIDRQTFSALPMIKGQQILCLLLNADTDTESE